MIQTSLFDNMQAERFVPKVSDITANRHGGNTRSAAANPSEEYKGTVRQKILAYGARVPNFTMKEAAAAIGKKEHAISGRFTELKVTREIIPAGVEDRAGCEVFEVAI